MFRDAEHHFCWSRYSKYFLDQDGIYYPFNCMIKPDEEIEVVEKKIQMIPMNWSEETEWVEISIELIFATSSLIPVITLPFYIVMSIILIVHYNERA